MRRHLFILFLLFSLAGVCYEEKGPSLNSLYTGLDPTSVSQHFAFYELYPDSPLGKAALRHAWNLLQGGSGTEKVLPSISIQPLIAFVNRLPSSRDAPVLEEEQ